MTIGQRIKRWRMRFDWDQKRLAVEAGVSRSAISNAERGKNSPTWDIIEKIIKGFDISDVIFFSLPEAEDYTSPGDVQSETGKGREGSSLAQVDYLSGIDMDFSDVDISSANRSDLLKLLAKIQEMFTSVIHALASAQLPESEGQHERHPGPNR